MVLVLHGGKADSFERSDPTHLSSRRLNPFVRKLHRRGKAHGIAVWKLRYRVRGWNGDARSAAQDAQWALGEVRRRHGDIPVVLVGHSMGGRAAVHVLGDPAVRGAVLLCPWLPHEPVAGVEGRRILLAHATTDRWTSPDETGRWAAAAGPLASALTYVRVRRSGHFMLRRADLWTDLAVGAALGWLGVDTPVGRGAQRALRAAADGATTVTV